MAPALRSDLLAFERSLHQRGYLHIAGVDEAGMGPLAGPVVAAAVILPAGVEIEGANDSKQLAPALRARLEIEIRERAIAFAIGVATVREIDRWNIRQAGLAAMRRALDGLASAPDYVLIDARTLPDLPWPQEGRVRADSEIHAVACASILAKEHRDRMMIRYDRRWPDYGFAQHKGYGTVSHRATLARLGPCPLHRRTFQWSAPVLPA